MSRRLHFSALSLALLTTAAYSAPPTPSPTTPATRPTWTPPKTTLPPKVVSAIRSLFLDGEAPMSIPTGEYRQVTLQITGPQIGDLQPVATHAWVTNPNSNPPQAVCWNGLTYPLQKIGPKADLDADIKAILDPERAALNAYLRAHGNYRNYLPSQQPFQDAGDHVGYTTFDLQHVAMLLRAGRTDLAEKFWSVLTTEIEDLDHSAYADPYDFLVYDYANALANRALGAFGRNQDQFALADARACVAACDIGRKILAERNPKPQNNVDGPDRDPFAQFEPVKLLVTEIERRNKLAPYDPVHLHPEKYPDKKSRIAGLIRDLELVGNYPAGTSADTFQIMPQVMQKLLVAEGDDIVEPLLECYEHDTRFTRRVSEPQSALFSEPPSLVPVPVADVALESVEKIVGYRLDDLPPLHEGVEMTPDLQHATALKDFKTLWAKLKQLPPEERQYAILADDDLTPDLWLRAAELITGRDSETRDAHWDHIRDHLRRLKNDQPSVHDLIVKRFRQLRDSKKSFQYGSAASFIDALIAWEGKAAFEAIGDYRPGPYFTLYLYEERTKLGDPRALHEYTEWLKTLTPKDRDAIGPNGIVSLFSLLCKNPDDPDAKAAAESVFQNPDSPWHTLFPVTLPRNASTYGIGDCLNSPLLILPTFRRKVFGLLDNKEKIGTIAINNAGQRDFQIDEGWFDPCKGGDIPIADRPNLQKHPIAIRPCDLVAAVISGAPWAPQFDIYADQNKRDAAIDLIKKYLTTYANHIALNSKNLRPYGPITLAFPPLHAPATPEQLAAGDAIFSLAGQGTSQIVNMKFPRLARWFTNTDFLTKDSDFDPVTGEKITYELNENEGTIWQAEDLTTNGKTQRYFGFLWKGGMQRVPAEQIDLLLDQPGPEWTELPNGVDLALILPGKPTIDTFPTEYHLTPSDPAILTLRLRNRRAAPQPIATFSPRLDPATHAVSLGAGLYLHLTKLRPGADFYYRPALAKSIPITPLHPLTAITPKPIDPIKSLRQPEAEFDAARIDLRGYFDLSQPGTYIPSITFDNTSVDNSPIVTGPLCIVIRPAEK